jgi:hypothetical protein
MSGSALPLLVGTLLALAVGGFASVVRLDRERAFYTTVMIVIAAYYVLFAVVGGTMDTLLAELAVAAVFVAGAVAGFKRGMWILVVFLCGHGVLDGFHGALITNPGVPPWWPPFCLAYDVVAGAYLAALLKVRQPAV